MISPEPYWEDGVVIFGLEKPGAGLLSVENLNLPVERHDPTAHYEAVKDKWFGLRTPEGR